MQWENPENPRNMSQICAKICTFWRNMCQICEICSKYKICTSHIPLLQKLGSAHSMMCAAVEQRPPPPSPTPGHTPFGTYTSRPPAGTGRADVAVWSRAATMNGWCSTCPMVGRFWGSWGGGEAKNAVTRHTCESHRKIGNQSGPP